MCTCWPARTRASSCASLIIFTRPFRISLKMVEIWNFRFVNKLSCQFIKCLYFKLTFKICLYLMFQYKVISHVSLKFDVKFAFLLSKKILYTDMHWVWKMHWNSYVFLATFKNPHGSSLRFWMAMDFEIISSMRRWGNIPLTFPGPSPARLHHLLHVIRSTVSCLIHSTIRRGTWGTRGNQKNIIMREESKEIYSCRCHGGTTYSVLSSCST